MGLSTKLSDEELPLKFEEIVDVKTYDKMRPPRPGGIVNLVSMYSSSNTNNFSPLLSSLVLA